MNQEDRTEYIHASLGSTSQVIGALESACGEAIIEMADRIIRAFKAGNKLLICGNGGSAADSQHIAAEFVVRFQKDRKALPAIALTTDTSILTAGGNDFGFLHVFERQVEALGREGDVFMGISTSGTSENIVTAMKIAKSGGMVCIAMTGEDRSPLSELADLAIRIPSAITARVQEGHIVVGHLICDLVERALF